MRPTRAYRSSVTALAGGLLLLSGIQPAFLASEGSSTPYIASYKQIGDVVGVTLVNPGTKAQTGRLVLALLVDGEKTLAVVPFTVMGGRKAFVSWVSPASIEGVIRVGIIVDDGAPI